MVDDVVIVTLTGKTVRNTVISRHHLSRLLSFDVRWYSIWDASEGAYIAIAHKGSTRIRLHRFITECSDNQYVLHLDGDGLNNLDENLLVTDRNRTGAKRTRRLDSGVGFDERRLMWYAVVEGVQTIGYFLSEKAAKDWFEQMSIP